MAHSKTADVDKNGLRAACAIFLLGMVLRLLGLGRELWLDEYVTVQTVGETLSQTFVRLRSDTHHPLYFLLLGQWARISAALPFLRGLSVLCDACSLLALMAWLRPMQRRASLWAGLFFATSPMLLRYGVELRPYALLSLATVLSFWATDALLRRPDVPRRYLGLCGAWLLLVATHPIAPMLIAPLTGWLVLEGLLAGVALRRGLLAASLLVPALVFALLHFVWALPHAAEAISWMPPLSTTLFAGTMRILFIDASEGVPAWLVMLQQVSWGVLWLLLLLRARGAEWKLAAVSGALMALIIAYSYAVEPIFWYRSLLPVLVGLAAHLALQVTRMRRLAVGVWVLLCTAQAIAWIHHAGAPLEPAITRALHAQFEPGDLVLYYPDFLALYVRGAAPAVPREAVRSLAAAQPGSAPLAPGATVYLVTRSDLPLARDPASLPGALQPWLPLLRRGAALELWVVPGHDVEIMQVQRVHDDVARRLASDLGEFVVLPPVGGLLRWRLAGPL